MYDFNESYARRRDHLLERMKNERWEVEEKICKKRGRKAKEPTKPAVDLDKPRNKGYNWLAK